MREIGMYAVLLVLLMFGCIATLTALGQNANNKFNTAGTRSRPAVEKPRHA
jgi:hypothetical protein